MRLPHDRRSKEWYGKYTDLVVRLRLVLYGHPDAGTCWVQHAETHVRSNGLVPLDDWRSCYHHPKLDIMRSVDVDDFKMAGPRG